MRQHRQRTKRQRISFPSSNYEILKLGEIFFPFTLEELLETVNKNRSEKHRFSSVSHMMRSNGFSSYSTMEKYSMGVKRLGRLADRLGIRILFGEKNQHRPFMAIEDVSEHIKKAGITRSVLAQRLRISEQQLSRSLNGITYFEHATYPWFIQYLADELYLTLYISRDGWSKPIGRVLP